MVKKELKHDSRTEIGKLAGKWLAARTACSPCLKGVHPLAISNVLPERVVEESVETWVPPTVQELCQEVGSALQLRPTTTSFEVPLIRYCTIMLNRWRQRIQRRSVSLRILYALALD